MSKTAPTWYEPEIADIDTTFGATKSAPVESAFVFTTTLPSLGPNMLLLALAPKKRTDTSAATPGVGDAEVLTIVPSFSANATTRRSRDAKSFSSTIYSNSKTSVPLPLTYCAVDPLLNAKIGTPKRVSTMTASLIRTRIKARSPVEYDNKPVSNLSIYAGIYSTDLNILNKM